MEYSMFGRTRSFWLRIFILILLLALLIRGIFYFSAVDPAQFRLLAHDWQEISFTTTLADNGKTSNAFILTDWTRGGVFEGETQFIFDSMDGIASEQIIGAVELNAADVKVTVVDVSDWNWVYDYDPEKSAYFIQLFRSDRAIAVAPPFENLPQELNENIVYQSENAENIHLFTIPAGEPREEFSSFLALTNEPMLFAWNLRRGCDINTRRFYDPVSQQKSGISIKEDCPSDRVFPYPMAEQYDSEAILRFASFHTFVGNGVILLAPISLTLEVDGWEPIKDTGLNYLILLRNPDGATWLDVKPVGLKRSTSFYTGIYSLDSDWRPISIEPNSQELTVTGATGRIAVDLTTISTDELSELSLSFDDWPIFTWNNQVIVQEDGTARNEQFLAGRGTAREVWLNGTNLVQTRWAYLSEEVQGAAIAALLSAIGWIIVSLLLDRSRSAEPAVIPVAVLHQAPIIQQPERRDKSLRWPLALIIGALAGLLLFWRKSSNRTP